MQRLHEYERPIAMLAAQQAEMNRDKKKRRKPYDISDFYLYVDGKKSDLPEGIYGAAAGKLIKMGKYPSWALFVYNDLKANAKDAAVPSDKDTALLSEHAIILAPRFSEEICQGMLIALHAASNQIVEFHDLLGNEYRILVPELKGQAIADEDAELRVL
jgi:hypothetical protein